MDNSILYLPLQQAQIGMAKLKSNGLELKLALPLELGSGKGENPEQLFAMGYAGNFFRNSENHRIRRDPSFVVSSMFHVQRSNLISYKGGLAEWVAEQFLWFSSSSPSLVQTYASPYFLMLSLLSPFSKPSLFRVHFINAMRPAAPVCIILYASSKTYFIECLIYSRQHHS